MTSYFGKYNRRSAVRQALYSKNFVKMLKFCKKITLRRSQAPERAGGVSARAFLSVQTTKSKPTIKKFLGDLYGRVRRRGSATSCATTLRNGFAQAGRLLGYVATVVFSVKIEGLVERAKANATRNAFVLASSFRVGEIVNDRRIAVATCRALGKRVRTDVNAGQF